MAHKKQRRDDNGMYKLLKYWPLIALFATGIAAATTIQIQAAASQSDIAENKAAIIQNQTAIDKVQDMTTRMEVRQGIILEDVREIKSDIKSLIRALRPERIVDNSENAP